MIPANAPAYNSHYSGLGRALCRGFISYTLFLALVVRDEVVARARDVETDGPSRKEEENERRRFEFGSRSRRAGEMLREREGACAKKVRNGFGVWEASRMNEGNLRLDGWVVDLTTFDFYPSLIWHSSLS